MTATDSSFGVLLKEYRLAAGLTQEALAERAGLSARNIQNLERGENHPLADTARVSGRAALPHPLTSFVGRERDIGLLRDLVEDGARLVTLVGVGRTGKTRLAVEAARAVEARFADGVAFVDLTATRDPALVPAVLAQALGLQETATGVSPARLWR